MSLDLRSPSGETCLQAIKRLSALKQSLTYTGDDCYSGGPNNHGCDSSDMSDLDCDLACYAMEFLPQILGTLTRIKAEADYLARDCPVMSKDKHACSACEIQFLVNEVLGGIAS